MKNASPESLISNQPGNPVVETVTDTVKGNKEEVVIYDECGDTMWDKVLTQVDKVMPFEKQDKDKA